MERAPDYDKIVKELVDWMSMVEGARAPSPEDLELPPFEAYAYQCILEMRNRNKGR